MLRLRMEVLHLSYRVPDPLWYFLYAFNRRRNFTRYQLLRPLSITSHAKRYRLKGNRLRDSIRPDEPAPGIWDIQEGSRS